jgi:hypothetical protein
MHILVESLRHCESHGCTPRLSLAAVERVGCGDVLLCSQSWMNYTYYDTQDFIIGAHFYYGFHAPAASPRYMSASLERTLMVASPVDFLLRGTIATCYEASPFYIITMGGASGTPAACHTTSLSLSLLLHHHLRLWLAGLRAARLQLSCLTTALGCTTT